MLEIGQALHRGIKRRDRPNQDALGMVLPGRLTRRRHPLLILADGMGGHQGGAEASQLLVRVMSRRYSKWWWRAKNNPAAQQKLLNSSLFVAHRRMRGLGRRNAEYAKMGSTIVAAILDAQRGQGLVMNVGDSRFYRGGPQGLELLSHDHSRVADEMRAGLLTEAEAAQHPRRSVLTMSISARRIREEISPHFTAFEFSDQDVLVACSDGVWSLVPESVLLATVLELAPQPAADKLAALALNYGGTDNISILIARKSGVPRDAEMLPDEFDPLEPA